METHQPHQTRTLGQEAVGALTRLHASPTKSGRGCANALNAILLIALINVFRYQGIPYLIKRFGGSHDDWLIAGALTISIPSYLIQCIILAAGHKKPEHVILKRGTTVFLPSSYPQIQARILSRILSPLPCLGMAICFLLFLMRAPTLIQQLLMACMSALFFYFAVPQVETLFYPLIRINDSGIQVKRHKLLWSTIERLQVENDFRGPTTTNWQFFDAAGKRLAQVSLQENSLPQQKEIISTIAEALNAQIEEYPPYKSTTRIENDSHSTLERPY